MYCHNCRTLLPDEANFCSNCGEPQNDRVKQPGNKNVLWEYCEICYEISEEVKMGGWLNQTTILKMRFWAKAIGPTGTYSAGESSFWEQEKRVTTNSNPPEINVARKAFDELFAKLLGNGWMVVSEGDWWYTHKFRRIVN